MRFKVLLITPVMFAAAAAVGALPQLTLAPVVSPSPVIGDGSTPHAVALTVSDGDGYNDIRDIRVLFNYTEAGGNPSLGRGYLLWGLTDAEITRYGGNFVIADAIGGGRWAYMTDNWGGTTYITPIDCEMTFSGAASGGLGSRTVTWTFAAKPTWVWNPLINDADTWYADAVSTSGWQDNPDFFDVVASTCTSYSDTPRAPVLTNVTPRSVDVTIDPGDSNTDLFAIRISPDIGGRMWVQEDGTLGLRAQWQTKDSWGTTRIDGLMWNTMYTFDARAARNLAGYCPSPWGPAAVATTLPYLMAIDYRQGSQFDVWVRGQCPYRMIATSSYPLLWDITYGSLARGLAGGLDADTYDWRDIYSGSNWGLGGGYYTTLEFLQHARDYQAVPMLTANMFGGGYQDADNDGVFVCQTDNPEGLAADWVRYTNIILQTYRQGEESSMTGEDLRVYNSIADWGGKPQLPAPGEPAVSPVQHWEIGNEPEVPGIHPMLNNHYLSPTDYRDRYKSMSQAMLAVDPALKFGPCLINPGDGGSQWLPVLAADAAVPIDFISYHPYYQPLKNAWGNPGAMTDALRLMKTELNRSSASIRAAMAQYGRSDYGLIASEWNPVNWDGTGEMQRSVANALGVAETVFTFAEDGVQGATFWEQPQYKLGPRDMFAGLRDYMGDTIVASHETFGLSPTDINWRCYVTKNASDDTRLYIWGLNFEDEQTATIDLSVPHCRINSAWMRRYGNPDGDTSLTMSTGMAWTEQAVAELDASQFTFTVLSAEAAILILDLTPLPRADSDLDGDVDQQDFGVFQRCLSGPTIPQTDPACRHALLDGDDDVDYYDLARFMSCFTGPGIPADYRCAD